MESGTARAAWLDRLVDTARRRPVLVLACAIGLHVLVWTVLPILTCPNLQLDLVEDLALGKEWQLGYWKHPPLPWWLADLAYRAVGHVEVVYALGPLMVALCFVGVWLLARETVGEFEALIAVVALEGIDFYNYSAVKFAHDQMQLPFWAFTGLFFWRALRHGRMPDWLFAGILLAGAFWSKYAAFALAATLGLILLVDPDARRAWRTGGPYLMALAFAVVIAPHAWWVLEHDFLPFRYLEGRAAPATHWYHTIAFPLVWIGNQALFLVPAAALLALLFRPGKLQHRPAPDRSAAFNRRYVTALALGPFVVTAVVSIVLGRRALAMWGYPLWSFAPLAVLTWAPPALDRLQLRRFAAATMAMMLVMPLAFAAVEAVEPLFRNHWKATQFQGRLLAETITQRWRDRTGTPLRYISGITAGEEIGRESPGWWEFPVNTVAVYSPDRPHVIVQGELRFSPWIDAADLDRRGAVVVWRGSDADLNKLRRIFPRAEIQDPLVLPARSGRPQAAESINYAIVPPRP